MHSFIDFIMGPMVWISFAVFIFGLVFRIYRLLSLVKRKERFIYTYLSLKHSLISILAWCIPFFAKSTRNHPVFCGISYIFHFLIFFVPIFLLSHITLLEEAIEFSWFAINEKLSDYLTIVVIIALIFFMIRRIVIPEVRFLTKLSDFVFLLIVAMPFITGFIAYNQFFAYKWMVIFHVISGEVILILIPFTRFAHMFMAPMTRAYMGSEFGKVRHARDW